jgi:hypothetical protein
MTADDVALLVDLLHLPYRHGPRAEALLGLLDGVRAAPADAALRAAFLAAAAQVEGLFERLTEIRQRELCYTLYPYLWDVKEELDILARYVDWLGRGGGAEAPGQPSLKPSRRRGRLRAALSGAAATYADDERPETLYPKFDGIYRGGLLADLQVPRRHPVS